MYTNHKFTREQLNKMKVPDLKKIVKEHNLHTQIKRYSKLKKGRIN